MTLIEFVVALIIIGIVAYLVFKYVPMPAIIVDILRIVLVVVVILMLLSLFGISIPFRLK